jgi:glucokinase
MSSQTHPPELRGAPGSLLGIDVGGTKILGGIVSSAGEVLFRHQIPTRREHLLEDIIATARIVIGEAVRRNMPSTAIGVGTTGFVDRERGVLVKSINMAISEIEIGPQLRARTGLSVVVDNDVHAATLGELYFGAGQTYRDFLLYNAGTGLATGLVFNGQLYRGVSNAAGENGHISSDQSGSTLSSSGMSGEIERLMLDARAGKETVPAHLPHIEAPPRREYGYVALNLVQLVNLLNPGAIILAGGMFSADPGAVEWVKRAVYAHALPIAVGGLSEISLSRTAPLTGLIGAAALTIEGKSLSSPMEPVP